MKHVLLINSDKMQPIRYFEKNKVDKLSIITKERYVGLYEGIGSVYTVDDITNLDQIKRAVIRIQKDQLIDCIVTPTEKSLLTGGYIRSYFGIPGPGFDVTLNFSNKLAMKNKLKNRDIPIADYQVLETMDSIPNVAKMLGWPLIIKPAMGAGSINTFCIKSNEEFLTHKRNGDFESLFNLYIPILAESYIEMQAEYHCDGLIQNGVPVFASISKYIEPVLDSINKYHGSHGIDKSSSEYKAISTLHEKVIQILGLKNGVTHMEVFKTERGFVFGEISCRPGGGGIAKTIKYNYGINIWDMYMEISLGNEISIDNSIPNKGYGWCGIPVMEGIVSELPELKQCDKDNAVIAMDLMYQIGDSVDPTISSGNYSGFVYYKLDEDKDILRIMNYIHKHFRIKTEEKTV